MYRGEEISRADGAVLVAGYGVFAYLLFP